MARFPRWVWSLVRWLAQPWLAWLILTSSVAGLWYALRPEADEFDVRLAGMIFQVFGLGTVAVGLHRTRRHFHLPTLGTWLRSWLGRRPKWRYDPIEGFGGGSFGAMRASGKLSVWTRIDPEWPLEKQVSGLARNVEHLRRELDQLDDKMEKHATEGGEALADEQKARKSGDESLRELFTAAHVGGIHIAAAGLIWLLLGILLTSLPNEVASLFS